MTPFFRYPIDTPVWWCRRILDTPWVVLRQRCTIGQARMVVEYYVEALSDPNLVAWALEADLWALEEVPGSVAGLS